MFTWAKIFSLFVTVALEIIKHLQRQQDYNMAKLQNAADYIRRANDLVIQAQVASNRVDDSDAAIVSDPDNRDERTSPPGANGLDTSATRLPIDVQDKV